jgi:hypothetical protein
LQQVDLREAPELILLYRDDPERYERAAARWIRRLVSERPRLRLSEVELDAGAFREALHSDRGVTTLREKALWIGDSQALKVGDVRPILGGAGSRVSLVSCPGSWP